MTAPDEIWWGEPPGHVWLARRQDAVDNLRIDPVRTTQIEPVVRGKHPLVIDRRNTLTTISFRVARMHGSPAEARMFLWWHARQVAEASSAARTLRASFFSSQQHSFGLPGAVITGMPGRHKGATTWHEYTIVGGAISEPVTAQASITTEEGGPLLTEDGAPIIQEGEL